jgi:hypothetical protein
VIRDSAAGRVFAPFAFLILAFSALLSVPKALAIETTRCTCADGRHVETGEVSYSLNSDRETITRVEANGSTLDSQCEAIWVASTQIRTQGTPYQFFLQRTSLGERRFSGCGDSDEKFVKRAKIYDFVFDSDSVSIREMRSVGSSETAINPSGNSNQNLWNSIAVDGDQGVFQVERQSASTLSSREFNRTSWVFARRRVKAQYLGILKDIDQRQRIVALKKSCAVDAGLLGQIEAAKDNRAIVRFYQGSRIEKFAKAKNTFRRWYDSVGGPYKEEKDDLYTPVRAYIVEVSLDDIVEVNDYLDQQKTDRTGSMNLWRAGLRP